MGAESAAKAAGATFAEWVAEEFRRARSSRSRGERGEAA